MSTSLLVTKMREAAASQGYDCEIEAHPVAKADDFADEIDVALIGPQIRFRLNELKASLSCPVEAIDMQAYGTMDGVKVIAQVRQILGD